MTLKTDRKPTHWHQMPVLVWSSYREKKRRKEGRSEKELIYVHWGRDSLLIELAFLPFIWIQKQALESHLWVNERKKVSALIPLNNLYYILSLHSLPPPPCVSLSIHPLIISISFEDVYFSSQNIIIITLIKVVMVIITSLITS